MKNIIATLALISLTGCSAVSGLISKVPSFWDDNQSAKIIDIRQSVEQITCEPDTQLKDASQLFGELQWFRLYSESKGQRQQDVLRIIAPMEETVKDWQKRSQVKEGSKSYCELKKRTLRLQASRAAESILGRY
jgi:hypothetical protein